MNDNTLHLTISGLKDHEVATLVQRAPVRHGVTISVLDLDQVEDVPDEHAEPESTGTVWLDVVPARGADGVIFPVVVNPAKPEPELVDQIVRAIRRAKRTTPAASPEQEASQESDTPEEQNTVALPEGRGVGYLASLVVDLPGNSMAAVIAYSRDEALHTYGRILRSIEARHPDRVASITRVLGREHIALTNGTTLKPEDTGRGRTQRAADLAIISARAEQYSPEMHERATHATAPKAGRILLAVESSAS